MNILLIDDDRPSRLSVAKFLRALGHAVTECEDGESAIVAFGEGDYPMVMSDIKMPALSGLDVLETIKKMPAGGETDVVLFTGHGSMESAIEALRRGAYDYLLKPINVEELAALTERIAEHHALRRENQRLKKIAAQCVGLDSMGVFSSAMQRLVDQARLYHQDRRIPVLIHGETGTGKEVLAKLIHFGDMDSEAPFVDINCAAITANLFENELFGCEAGSCIGSLAGDKIGKLDLAQGGTIFLDEVGEIPLELQGKLLRVIQEKEFYRVGGLQKLKADVRIICATTIDLEQCVAKGTFRKDLYFRLKVGYLHIPPLRERKEAILGLAEMFLTRFAQEKGKRFQRISPAAAEYLAGYRWPGNVRELKNAIEWAVFMHNASELLPEHLNIPCEDSGQQMGDPLETATAVYTKGELPFTLPPGSFELEAFIDNILREAVAFHNGNKTAAAQYLGMSRRALCYRLDNMEGRR